MDRKQLPPGMRNYTLLALHDVFFKETPQLYAWLTDDESFERLSVKRRDDGSFIAVAKGYDSKGGPVVAFGSGLDVFSCLQGLQGAITAGNWREDKPWSGKGG